MRAHFAVERAVLVLGILSMVGFVAAYLGVASGRLDSQGYLAFSFGSLLGYGAALWIVFQRPVRAWRVWTSAAEGGRGLRRV